MVVEGETIDEGEVGGDGVWSFAGNEWIKECRPVYQPDMRPYLIKLNRHIKRPNLNFFEYYVEIPEELDVINEEEESYIETEMQDHDSHSNDEN